MNERLPQMLDQVSRQYDIVLVDAPPALLVSDVAVIGAHIGTTFLVVRDSLSTIADLHVTLKRLEQARIEAKGAHLTASCNASPAIMAMGTDISMVGTSRGVLREQK